MNKEEFVRYLENMGVKVEAGMIRKSDVKRVLAKMDDSKRGLDQFRSLVRGKRNAIKNLIHEVQYLTNNTAWMSLMPKDKSKMIMDYIKRSLDHIEFGRVYLEKANKNVNNYLMDLNSEEDTHE